MSNFLYKKGYLRESVGWRFFNRGGTKFPLGFTDALQEQVNSWSGLAFTDEMLTHLEKTMYWLDYFYIWSYLKSYRFEPECIRIKSIPYKDYEDVEVTYEGEWGKVIFFEIYLLSTMSELYNLMTDMGKSIISVDGQQERNSNKIKLIASCGAKVAEFGTRRRYSKSVHEQFLVQFKNEAPEVLQGTSNAMFSRKFNLTPIGTFGHELVMFIGAKFNPAMANRIVMKEWVDVYNGALGIYLPDTYTTKLFLTDFDLFNSKLWDGVREDSSPDTDNFVDMLIDHYKKHRIDPATKIINHSNAINSIERLIHMQHYREGEIRRNFGIGTWLTNDVYPEKSSLKPVDWVIKMTHIIIDNKLRYCVKLSDTPQKILSINQSSVEWYMRELGLF
jgi:nicotinate phosphoribosyltransferase